MRHENLYFIDIVEAADHIAQVIAGIDWDVVWRAATNRCPVLRVQGSGILAAKFSGPTGGCAE